MDIFQELSSALSQVGLIIRGGFHEDGTTLYLVGHGGSSFWESFSSSDFFDQEDNPLDNWSKQVIGEIASALDGQAIYPSDGPPYAPFQQWVRKSEGLLQSPLGMMIHPEFGLWHAYRGAICFEGIHELPDKSEISDICGTCMDKPCLNTCPVDAFSMDGYDVPVCAAHIKTSDTKDCMSKGCFARRNCPNGQEYIYQSDHANFHMKAFCGNH
ncbi:ferredoxin [Curvivirga sp.]|uniref:ferredoxin n=1 Tax=Curvivirga sp. TaxID=2856848 RepID=UPI003B5CE1FB